MNDQATQLRRLVRGTSPAEAAPRLWRAPAARPRLAAAVAVTSGKGGVGKSNIAVNLAVRLARLGRRVCLLDADLGLANADVLCNLTPRLTLEHVVSGRCRLADAMLNAPGSFRLIPGACGVARLADLDGAARADLLEQFQALDRVADCLVIDTAAGLGANVLAFAAAAGRVLVVTTPEPTAMTDAYAMIKALAQQAQELRIELVVNMAESAEEARSVHDRMSRVARAFLGRSVELAGWVAADPLVPEAVRHRVPFTLYAPDSRAARQLERLARHVAGLDGDGEAQGYGFFGRLAMWLTPGRRGGAK
jgi:flagellar biosynthesis protein FlhG